MSNTSVVKACLFFARGDSSKWQYYLAKSNVENHLWRSCDPGDGREIPQSEVTVKHPFSCAD